MIWRIWTVLLVVLVGGVWTLSIPYSPKPILETGTVIKLYRAMGIVPEVGGMTVSDAIDHDVFEVPDEDGEQLKAVMAGGGANMGGMEMEGMAEQPAEPAKGAMSGMKTEDMAKQAVAAAKEAMPGTKMEDMAKEPAEHAKEAMPGMKMEGMAKEAAEHAKEGMGEPEEHGEEKAGGHGGGGPAAGLSVLAQGSAAAVEGMIAAKAIRVDKTAAIDMREWSFAEGKDPGMGMVTAKPGDIVRLRITNTGNIPHEFMLMSGPAMAAVNYRLIRADWNLLEHEALTEVPFIMPGDSVDMVVRIHRPGQWMYMCMFPYHMQLGMMGVLMTPDMMGKGGMSMGGMKM